MPREVVIRRLSDPGTGCSMLRVELTSLELLLHLSATQALAHSDGVCYPEGVTCTDSLGHWPLT